MKLAKSLQFVSLAVAFGLLSYFALLSAHPVAAMAYFTLAALALVGVVAT